MIARKPAAFGDLRGWIAALKAHDELQEIDAEVDWNIELGTIMRLAQGPGTGRAMLFNNIKDYNKPDSRCRREYARNDLTPRPGCGAAAAGLRTGTPPASFPGLDPGSFQPQSLERSPLSRGKALRPEPGNRRIEGDE